MKGTILHLGPAELAILQPFGHENHSRAVPEHQLDAIRAFGAVASSRIRAFSSADQRRRPPTPVMISRRRTGRGGSSIWSTIDTKRSSIQDRQSRCSDMPM